MGAGWEIGAMQEREEREEKDRIVCRLTVLIPSNPPHLRLCHLINQWN